MNCEISRGLQKTYEKAIRIASLGTGQLHLLDDLMDLRRRLAGIQGVKPFEIAYDRTLLEICEVLPITIPELQSIHGFGRHRLTYYGESFVAAVRLRLGLELEE